MAGSQVWSWFPPEGGSEQYPAADPVGLTGALNRLPRAFVRCIASELAQGASGDPIIPMAARARSEGWLYRELSAPHDPQLTGSVTTALNLHELSTAAERVVGCSAQPGARSQRRIVACASDRSQSHEPELRQSPYGGVETPPPDFSIKRPSLIVRTISFDSSRYQVPSSNRMAG